MSGPPPDRTWVQMTDRGPFTHHAAAFFFTVDALEPGEDMRYGFRVEHHHCNLRPICHGGMLTTFLDVALAHGLRTASRATSPFSTMSMSMDFMAPAALGAWVEARVSVSRVGKSTAFISARLHVDDEMIARGSAVFRHMGVQG